MLGRGIRNYRLDRFSIPTSFLRGIVGFAFAKFKMARLVKVDVQVSLSLQYHLHSSWRRVILLSLKQSSKD